MPQHEKWIIWLNCLLLYDILPYYSWTWKKNKSQLKALTRSQRFKQSKRASTNTRNIKNKTFCQINIRTPYFILKVVKPFCWDMNKTLNIKKKEKQSWWGQRFPFAIARPLEICPRNPSIPWNVVYKTPSQLTLLLQLREAQITRWRSQSQLTAGPSTRLWLLDS